MEKYINKIINALAKTETKSLVLEPGAVFIAYDLYDMSDVFGDNWQECTFLYWSEDGEAVRIRNNENSDEFYTAPEHVMVVAVVAPAEQAVA